MTVESALVIMIPEAEILVETFRRKYDPSAAIGVPAHVTILYPFKSPGEITSEITATLRELFMKKSAFTASFFRAQRFPDALFLAPEPAEAFRMLTEAVVKAFPDTPPYGGAFKEIIPHLTVAQVNDSAQLDEIEADFQRVARNKLPIHARVNTVSLMDSSSDYWQIRGQFSLNTI